MFANELIMFQIRRKEHVKIIDMIMQELSAEQQRWVIRIILKGNGNLQRWPEAAF